MHTVPTTVARPLEPWIAHKRALVGLSRTPLAAFLFFSGRNPRSLVGACLPVRLHRNLACHAPHGLLISMLNDPAFRVALAVDTTLLVVMVALLLLLLLLLLLRCLSCGGAATTSSSA